jgi:hypothetical protein
MMTKLDTGSTELVYTLTTTPNMVVASGPAVQITITAVNPLPDPDSNTVGLNEVVIQFPIGDGENELCATSGDLSAGVPTPGDWSVTTNTPTGFVQYVFRPKPKPNSPPPPPIQIGSAGLTFNFTNVTVNDQNGTVDIVLTECNTDCTNWPDDCPTASFSLTKFPNAWDQITFTASPANIDYGQTTTLSWSGPAGATYTIQYVESGNIVTIPAKGQKPLSNQEQYPPLTPANSTTYTLYVQETISGWNYAWQLSQPVTVIQPQPLITSFTGSLDESTSQLTFNWTTEHVQNGHCTLSAVAVELNPNGSNYKIPLTPLQGVYTLIAVADAGESRPSRLGVTWMLGGNWQGSTSNPPNPIDLVLSPDNTRLYVANNSQVSVFTPTGEVNAPLQTSSLAITTKDVTTIYTAVTVSADGSMLYVAAAAGNPPAFQIQAFSTSNLSSQIGSGASIAGSVWITNLAVWSGSAGSYLFAVDDSNFNLLVFTITGNDSNPLQAFGSPLGISGLSGVRTSPDGTSLYVLTGNAIGVYTPTGDSTKPLKHVTTYQLGNTMAIQGFGVAAGIGYPVALYSNQSQVVMFDAGGRTVGPPVTISGTTGSVAVSPDGMRVYAGMSDSSIWVLAPDGLAAA